MAGGSDCALKAALVRTAMEQADASPGFVFIQPIQIMAGSHTSLAARTQVEVYGKGILLTRRRCPSGKELTVCAGVSATVGFVLLRETLDGRQGLLLGQQLINQGLNLVRRRFCHSSFEKMAWMVLRS
jgi:hypothetical protein